MSTNLTRPWGADETDTANNKPSGAAWKYIGQQMALNTANVVADQRGWKLQLPGGGEEILVALSGNPAALVCAAIGDMSGVVHKLAGQVLAVRVQTSTGLDLGAANTANLWITAISNDANIANVVLLYSAAESVPASGELVFRSAATSMAAANTSPATKLTVNTTSIINGNAQIKPRKPTHAPGNAATTIGATSNVVIPVVV